MAEWRVRKGSKKKESVLPIAVQILLKLRVTGVKGHDFDFVML